MYADHSAFSGLHPRTGAFFPQETMQRVDACAFAGVYNAPRFTCDPLAYRALLLTPG